MLDIGFSELLLIALVALIVIGPKDLPAVVRHGAKFLREMREVYSGLKRQMTEVMDEVGASDIKREMTTIIDLEGKPQPAYDVRDLEGLKQPPVTSHQSPVASKEEVARVQSPESSEDATRAVVPLPLRERLGEGVLSVSAERSTPLTQPSPAGGEGLPLAPVTKP